LQQVTFDGEICYMNALVVIMVIVKIVDMVIVKTVDMVMIVVKTADMVDVKTVAMVIVVKATIARTVPIKSAVSESPVLLVSLFPSLQDHHILHTLETSPTMFVMQTLSNSSRAA